MKTRVRQLSTFAAMIFLGIAIGFAAGQSAGSGDRLAIAAPPHAEQRAANLHQGEKPPLDAQKRPAKRVGCVVGLNRETMQEYVTLHKYVWPQVLDRIRKSNIRNYTIYLGELDDGNLYVFANFEYAGDDYEADMKAMADDPATQDWWKLCDPLQKRVKGTPELQQWKTIEEVFHAD